MGINDRVKRKIKKSLYGSCFLAALSLQACVSETPENCAPDRDAASGGSITVAAHIAESTYTRAYQADGRVVSGNYYLCYPDVNNLDAVAVVDFDMLAAESPGLGIVTTPSGTELEWTNIGGSTVNFTLDNVSYLHGDGSVVDFTDSYNPFKSGVFDSENGSNDLLWGEKSAMRNTKNLDFDLHHYMSRLRVEVQVLHLDNSVGVIDLEGATVRISNVYPSPLSYSRKDGSLTLDTENGASGIMVVSSDNQNYPGYDWLSPTTTGTTPEGVEYTTYVSQDIVLPPQSLFEDENRPKLEIELANGDVYTGILPHTMLIANGDNTSLDYPVTLSFLKEHILTLRTVITEEPPELAFMPVWVVEWVDKGDFTFEAHQSGIYSAAQFYKLEDYYRNNNEYQLVRYGYLHTPDNSTEEQWLFNFFSGAVLSYNMIFGQMIPYTNVPGKGETKNFTFSFNNYSIFVQNGDDESDMVQVSEDQLYRIVTGKLNWNQLK